MIQILCVERTRFLLLIFLLAGLGFGSVASAAPQRKKSRKNGLERVQELLGSAGKDFKASDFRKSAASFRKAKREMEKLLKSKGDDISPEMEAEYKRLKKAHSLLISKGIDLKELFLLRSESKTGAGILAKVESVRPTRKANSHNDNYESRGDPFLYEDGESPLDSYYYITPEEAARKSKKNKRSSKKKSK